MSIYRGTGGSSTTTDETTINAVNQKAAEAATSATNAASSASSASTSASNSATSASQAATSATNAATSASQALQSKNTAGTSATAAQAAQVAAETAQVEAESAKDTAVTYGSNAVSANTTAQAAKTAAETARDVTLGYRDEVLAADSTAAASATAAADSATAAGLSATSAAASASAAATTASESEAALQAIADSVKSFYLGAEASAPTVDDNGDALEAGDWYFNTTDNLTYVYNGSSWQVTVTDLTGVLVSSNNLSELTNTTTARSNLGLGTAATTASTDYATAAQGALADSALQSIPDNYVLNTGDSITGNLSFGDNDKAIFGAGSDLQIYHDGSNSRIKDTGTGALVLQTNQVNILSTTGEQVALFNENSNVKLYYDNAVKLATTSTGIDVTGTATMDGLTVDGGDNTTHATFGGGRQLSIKSEQLSGVYDDAIYKFDINSVLGVFKFSNAANTKDLLKLDYNGDISFYEDTGTTAKFFWDASAESLGIGTSSPTYNLHIASSDNSPNLGLRAGDTTSSCSIYFGDTGSTTVGAIQYVHSDNYMQFDVNASERLRIDSSGNVGIGTSSPATGIEVGTSNYKYAGTNYDIYGLFGSSATGGIRLGNDSVTGAGVIGNAGENPITFVTYSGSAWGERMRIDSSGNVGIGTSSPSGVLDLHSSSSPKLAMYNSNATSNDSHTFQIEAYDSATAYWNRLNLNASSHTFSTYNAERMRIDSSGNLLVGTTTAGTTKIHSASGLSVNDTTNLVSSSTGGGLYYHPSSDYLTIARSAGTPLFVNRTGSSDGEIINLRKDGTTVGSIGSYNGFMYVGSPSGNDAYMLMGSDFIAPSTSTGTARDAAIDLGSSSRRFKDLYLSGGVYLGGTGSANYLDDYEEGEHTTTFTPATSGTISLNSASDILSYTKVGRSVTITGQILVTGISSAVGTYFNVSLPFSALSLGENQERLGCGVVRLIGGTYTVVPAALIVGSDLRVYVDASTLTTDQFHFNFTYVAA